MNSSPLIRSASPNPDVKRRGLRPARSFNVLADRENQSRVKSDRAYRPTAEKSGQASTSKQRPSRTRESSNEAGSESSHHQTNPPDEFDQAVLAEEYFRIHQHPRDECDFPKAQRRSLPTSHSVSTVGSSFEFDDSPAPSPFFVPPPRDMSLAELAAGGRENIAVPREKTPGTRKLDARPEPLGPISDPTLNQPIRSANAVMQHVRVKAGATTFGFPFTSSILATSDSFADLRGPSGRTSVPPPRQEGHMRTATSASKGTASSHRLSSDVDLELSFDYHQESEIIVEDEVSIESVTAAWVGIDMTDEDGPIEHDVPEGELVRSPSGRLVGTNRNRVRSAGDLRAQFRRGAEAVAINMEEDVDLPGPHPSTASPSETSTSRGEGHAILPVGAFGRKVPAPIKTIRPLSMGKGFAYNPTDPVTIPLPDSPATSPVPSPSLASEVKAFPLPLRLLDRARKTSPLISPVLGSPSNDYDVKGKGKGKTVEEQIDLHQFVTEDEAEQKAEVSRQYWLTQLAHAALAKWNSSSAVVPAAPLSSRRVRTQTDDTPSPGLRSLFEHPQHSSSAETFDTAQTTPNPDERGFDEDYDTLPTSNLARSPKQSDDLAGLGIAFEPTGNSTDYERSVRLPSSNKGKGKAVLATPRATGHRTIPSLSVTRPVEDGHETASVSSNDSASDPTVSPSRRISRRLSGVPSASSERGASTVRQRAQFGSGSSHLLVSETMPRARLPHQTSLNSTRFSFAPAPLELVQSHLLRAAGYETTNTATASNMSADHRRRRHSMISLVDMTTAAPGHFLETTVPSKILFYAGWLLGPWCWVIGGWWLRSLDGELMKTRGIRCRSAGCHCGRMVQNGKLLGTTRSHGPLIREQNENEGPKWLGLDEWVFMNRVLALGSGVVVSVIVAIALWQALLAA